MATDSPSPRPPGRARFTDESGKHRAVGFRHQVDTKLRRALTDFAHDSRHANPWAADRGGGLTQGYSVAATVTIAATVPEDCGSRTPVGRGRGRLDRVEGDRLLERYRRGQDPIVGAAAVEPESTGIVCCWHGRHLFVRRGPRC